MRKLICLFLLAATPLLAATYLVHRGTGVVVAKVRPAALAISDGRISGVPGVTGAAAGVMSLVQADDASLPGPTEPNMLLGALENVQSNVPCTEENLDALRQEEKSLLHKTADNALITVLIRGGLVPEGTTALSPGTEDAVTAQLLQAEVLDPTNTAVQALSTKLSKITAIIRREGGDPDNAIVHE